ncbi:MAG TPA: aspartyl protease family protein [Brevundimonas sp.]|uniref:aspartyl protease family protein n=1 Tax=Brevundimonas sp. TaxID=1871086 RepID=UPI00261CFF82|nr:aspartyl protease family protein [Brevundimonas sp.]HRO33989.1 aspartyl protease family protein [Brevundimonas sp.]
MTEGVEECTVSSRRAFILGSLGALALGPALARPVLKRTYAFADGTGGTLSHPFEFWRRSQIFLTGSFNGHSVEMLLDSGAEHSIVDSSLAAEVGLSVDGALNVEGLSGTAAGHGMSFRNAVIDLDGLVLTTNWIAILDLSPFAGPMGRPVRMILGRDLFDQLMVDLDFDHEQITFHDPRRVPSPSDMRGLRISRSDSLPNIPLRVDGSRHILAGFDLGSDDALSLSADFVSGHRSLRRRQTATAQFLGVEGWSTTRMLTVGDVNLAGETFQDFPADVPHSWIRRRPNEPQANLGIELIRQFRVTTDFTRGRLWLRRRSVTEPFWRDQTGFMAASRGDHREVVMVVPGGPAERAGLKLGDRIIAIDGRPTGSDSTSPEPVTNVPEGTPVRLTLEGGAERVIVQVFYY